LRASLRFRRSTATSLAWLSRRISVWCEGDQAIGNGGDRRADNPVGQETRIVPILYCLKVKTKIKQLIKNNLVKKRLLYHNW
jgi:hypothetical protein